MKDTDSDYKTHGYENKPHPWRRFFAFCFDVAYMTVIVNLIWLFVFNQYPSANWFWERSGYILLCVFVAFVEPLLIMSWVSTTGKALFGIRILHKSGRKLTYKEGLVRSFRRLRYGMGFMIPVYSWYRLYKSYKKCAAGECMEWDADVRYDMPEKTRPFKYIFFISVIILVHFLAEYQGMLPKNRGDLTVDEFVDNYNRAAAYFGYEYQTLDTDGTVYIDEEFEDMYPAPPTFRFETEENILKAVSFEYSGSWNDIQKYEGYDYLTIHSFLGARVNCFEYSEYKEVINKCTKQTFSDILMKYKDVYIEKYTDLFNEHPFALLGSALNEKNGDEAEFIISFDIWLQES